jgi:sugar lactone lactonase YvrE
MGSKLGVQLCLWAALFLVSAPALVAKALPGPTESWIQESVVLPRADYAYLGRHPIIRPTLSAAEDEALIAFSIALKMPDIAGLKGRLARKERISEVEMESSYRPQKTHYTEISRWLEKQGFEITLVDHTHTTIFARGKIKAVAQLFQVEFGRVATPEGEFTSALSAPIVPARFAEFILSINGLQPQLRPQRAATTEFTPIQPRKTDKGILPGGAGVAITPKDLAAAYRLPTQYDGAGQTIALIEMSGVNLSDLSAYWTAMDVKQSTSNLTIIGSSALSKDTSLFAEATLDVEWAGALAPAAKLRVYVASDSFDATNTQILNDRVANGIPISVLSISFCSLESDLSPGQIAASAQIYAQLAAAGVTTFASSGDTGTNAAIAGGGGAYNANFPLIVAYPASDPSVTGVGGTTMSLDQNYNNKGEVVWSYIQTGGPHASGGGISTVFSKPAWQTGHSALDSATMRSVPDLAAIAESGAAYMAGVWGTVGGTSLSAPIWAGIGALLNQARATAGTAPIGLLNSYIYSATLNRAFTDITLGMNGAYTAGAGYDLCTGLGTPQVDNFISILASSALIKINAQPASTSVNLGQSTTLGVTANATVGTLIYQWFFNGVIIPGATRASYTIASAALTHAGAYAVSITGQQGTVTSLSADLKVNYLTAVQTHPLDTTLSEGQNIVLTVGVSGYPLPSYQWQQSNDGGATWITLSDTGLRYGTTTEKLILGAANKTLSGAQFRVVVSNAGGSTTSKAATITVNTATPNSVVYVTSTLAGEPSWGYSDGKGLDAHFYSPKGLAIGPSGNLYVTDFANHVIRKVTPEGVVTTLAGKYGATGTANGPATSATFNYPNGIAVDSAETIYVVDGNQGLIRKISAAGVVCTLAGGGGNGGPGAVDGLGSAANFRGPTKLTVDAQGNIYVTDTGNHTIRKITAAGLVSTVAGKAGVSGTADGAGSEARFWSPGGIVIDAAGNLFVSDSFNHRIRKITPAGVVTTLAGDGVYGYKDATGLAARFFEPTGMTIDPTGNLYAADKENQLIRKITPAGVVTTVAGASASWVNKLIYCPIDPNFETGLQGHKGSIDGTAANALFNSPNDVAIDKSGNLYVADVENHTIRKISSQGTVTTLAGSPPANINAAGKNASFSYPKAIALDNDGNAYLTDTQNYTIRKITPEGLTTTIAGQPGAFGTQNGISSQARFDAPLGIAVDPSGNIFVADDANHTVRKITPSGVVSLYAGIPGTFGSDNGPALRATFCNLRHLATDRSGNLYVVDQGNFLVRKITPAGVVSTLAGTAKLAVPTHLDGVGTAAKFKVLEGIAVDSVGNVFVTQGSCIRKITPEGVVSTFAGDPQTGGVIDGVGVAALFNSATGITIDAADNLFVSDASASIIRKITPDRVVTTIAGTAGPYGGQYGYKDGAALSSLLYFPWALAVNKSGAIIVADTQNSTLRLLTPVDAAPSSAASPSITSQPTAQTVTAGAAVTLSVTASGTVSTYQWFLNGVAVAGATTSVYTIPRATSPNAGTYTVVVSNSAGSTTSNAATLNVNAPENPGRLINLSVLSMTGPGSQLLIVGFVSGGSGTSGSQNLLIRGTGPALTRFNVAPVLPDPTLNLLSGQTIIATNDNWSSDQTNTIEVVAANQATGAFGLSIGTLDAALVKNVTKGSYSAHLAGKNGATGFALAEVYDTTSTENTSAIQPRLINVSCLQYIAANGTLTAGFVIGGTTEVNVLVRASGPTLAAAPFNLPGMMPDPKVTVLNNSAVIQATNSGWLGDPAIMGAAATVGAFNFVSPSSKDSAVVLKLQPGSYSAQVTSASSAAGIALVEIYEIRSN